MKKWVNMWLAILLVLVMVASMATVMVFASGEPPMKNGVYQLSTAEDLFWFAETVNGGNAKISAELTQNIDLQNQEWTPIGAYFGEQDYFSGNFNGNNFTISGLSIQAGDDRELYYAGLFGYMQGATVKNLKVEGQIYASEGCYTIQTAGSIAGTVINSIIENCKSSVNFNLGITDRVVGGIVGAVELAPGGVETSVLGCSNWGNIQTADGNIVGGIVGASIDAVITMKNCYNRGSVKAGSGSQVGGLVGSASNAEMYMSSCYSSATIEERDDILGGMSTTGLIQGEYGGDLFGVAGPPEYLSRIYGVTDILEGIENVYYHDIKDSCNLFAFADAAELTGALNAGDNSEAFVIDTNGYGNGWPVCAWELVEAQSPDQQDMALNTAKSTAKANLKAVYQGYQKTDYEPSDWESLTAHYRAGMEAIDAAEKVADVTVAEENARSAMAGVPSKADHLATAQEEARKAVEHAYSYREDEKELGLRAELETYIEKLYRQGVVHSLLKQFENSLRQDLTVLEHTKNNGIEQINSAKSKTEVEMAKTKTIQAMEAFVSAVKEKRPDTGVAEPWDGVAKNRPTGSGTEESPYQIGTGAELAWFAEQVNAADGSRLCAVLTQDIDLNYKLWTPIAMRGRDGYLGTFDGQNHTVHNIHVKMAVKEEDNQYDIFGGLFGNVGREFRGKYGTVKNLKVGGVMSMERQIQGSTGNRRFKSGMGGIAGKSSGVIYNCESSVLLTNGTDINEAYDHRCAYNLGGIVGIQSQGIIEKCVSYAHVEETKVNNRTKGSVDNYIGGIAGVSEGASLIRYCTSYAVVQDTFNYVGGIVGAIGEQAQIRECVNYGSLQATGYCVGGIAGLLTDQAGITYAENKGEVLADKSVGGIVGFVRTDGTISYVYNQGKVTAKEKYAGGLIGEFEKGKILHAQSSSDNTLWGYADAQNADSFDALKTEYVDGFVSTNFPDKSLSWEKLEATRILMGKMKRPTDSKYGEQSAYYNEQVLKYIRAVEMAKSVQEVKAKLEQAEKELENIPTGLELEKKKLIADLESYISGRIYDETDAETMKALLEEAKAKVEEENVNSLKKLQAIREEYLGTEEKPGKFETTCDTYNKKAQTDLYNEFIFEKKYSTENMAKLLNIYNDWATQLQRAASVETIETLYADARFALKQATADMTQTDKVPDMSEAANAALQLSKDSAKLEIAKKAEEYKKQIERLFQDGTEGKEFSNSYFNALERMKNEAISWLEETAQVDFDGVTDHQQVQNLKKGVLARMETYSADACARLTKLIEEAQQAQNTAWDGSAKTQPKGDGTAEYPYQIGTGAELAWFADKVNEEKNEDLYAVLTADVDLGYCDWTPIGISENYKMSFSGGFDGQGHTIKGLYIGSDYAHKTQERHYGLFGVLRGAVIKNLTVKGMIKLGTVEEESYIGGLAGTISHGDTELINCTLDVDIVIADIANRSAENSKIGGIVGKAHWSENLKIDKCIHKGNITVEKTGTSSICICGIGGIIGILETPVELTRTVNTGTISIHKGTGVGGIVGYIDILGDGEAAITDCVNQGTIINDEGNVLDSVGGTGGILGVCEYSACTISGCYNTGVLRVSKIAGGILGGENNNYGVGASTTGNEKLTIENCYSAGDIIGPNNATANKIGSLAGYPIDGIYKDKLFVRKGVAQAAMGWKCSQGDRIQTVTGEQIIKQFADGIHMVPSIAELNGGYPMYPWQISQTDNRLAIAAYLENFYQTEIKLYATAEQQQKIEAVIKKEKAAVLNPENDADQIIAAYSRAIASMNMEQLLTEARDAAVEKLNEKTQHYTSLYAQISSQIVNLSESVHQQIAEVRKPSQLESLLDTFAAGVTDLLIDEIGSVHDDMTEEEATKAKDKIQAAETAYEQLTDSQKEQVSKYFTLNTAKAAMQSYETTMANNRKMVADVVDKINAIGNVSLEKKAVVEAALSAYNGLTAKQKAMVPAKDYNALLAAWERIQQLDADANAAGKVIRKIQGIGHVTLESKKAIEEARNAYNALTDAQKTLVHKNVLELLVSAEKRYQELVNQEKPPVVPAEPSAPTKPQPAEPQAPTEPQEPTEPQVPTEPQIPTEPQEPTKPETPTEPERPTNPEKPTEPAQESKPVTPAQPDENGASNMHVLWISVSAIAMVALVVFLVWWFTAAKNKKRKH